jgi:hypothetical protein
MKKVIFIVVGFLLNIGLVYSQSSPKGISYQAVAINNQVQSVAGKNPENTYWANRDIQVRFTIYNKYPSGAAQMVENHQIKTDNFGVFNVVIGQGANTSGDLFDVDWNLGQAHLQVEIDFENNGLYKLIGIERFWSVPYALNAGNGNNNVGNADAISKKLDSIVNDFNKKIADFKTEINLLDTSKTNEIQDLEYSGNSIGLTKSKKKILLRDNEIGNELQSIKLFNDTLIISGLDTFKGGAEFSSKVALKFDKSDTNELQKIYITGDSIIGLTRGNFVNITSLNTNKNSIKPSNFLSKSDTIYATFLSARTYNKWKDFFGKKIIYEIELDSGSMLTLNFNEDNQVLGSPSTETTPTRPRLFYQNGEIYPTASIALLGGTFKYKNEYFVSKRGKYQIIGELNVAYQTDFTSITYFRPIQPFLIQSR